MRLYQFIESSMEQILQAWEDFARSVETDPPVQDAERLRNHAEKILRTVAADMRTAQSDVQQVEKAQGRGPGEASDSAAETHAITRLIAGFTMDQMVSEYRALRSSVLTLWLKQEIMDQRYHIDDMIRFNEAIDQALVESIAAYGKAVETTRKRVLGVLGHDLRSPLGAVMMAGDLLVRQLGDNQKGKMLAAQVCTSARRANAMVHDLLDLARCNLGAGIPVQLERTDLNTVCRSVVEEMRVAFPLCHIDYREAAQVKGLYDPARMAQVFSNLIGNALRHGNPSLPVVVTILKDADGPRVSVHNSGEPIPPEAMINLFKPEGRYSEYAHNESGPSAGLGLGLFIAAEIVTNHGGKIAVQSTAESGTTFEVILSGSADLAPPKT